MVNSIRLLYEDKFLRGHLVEIFNSLMNSGTPAITVADYISKNAIKATLYVIGEFKDYDALLRDLYGYTEASYDFEFLNSCLNFLNGCITHSSAAPELVLALANQFDRAGLEKIQSILIILHEDSKHYRIDFIDIGTHFARVFAYLHS